MVDPDDGAGLESRPPVLEDLLKICRALNEQGARYIVVGGMAVIQAGFVRATEDIDLLVEGSPENFARVQAGLSVLPDGAVREVTAEDLERYVVVRVADEVVVDLLRQKTSQARVEMVADGFENGNPVAVAAHPPPGTFIAAVFGSP